MRIAILHFHLRQGGVTRIIEMACAALHEQGMDPIVISGEPPPPGCRVPADRVAVVPSLAYEVEANRAEELLQKVDAAMQRVWGAPADVIHLHNHSLGKNFALPLVVSAWAREGRALALQIHDFAENGRPVNYRKLLCQLGGSEGLARTLYPASPRVGYALLNSADCARLQAVSHPGTCRVLPNPVALPEGGGPVAKSLVGAERMIVYPTRAIRRKNLGEALLWSTRSPAGEKIVLTAAPESPRDRAIHDEWQVFAMAHALPVGFDAQANFRRPLIDFVRGADLCLTTSVGEGFGMAFLEPWAAGCGLAGRDLPAVTQDFESCGLQLDHLYGRIGVPAGWLGDLTPWLRQEVRVACEAYQKPFDESLVRQALDSMSLDGKVDFGALAEFHQRAILTGIVEGRFDIDEILPTGLGECSPAKIAANRKVIEESFSLGAYGHRLLALYGTLVETPSGPSEALDAARLLDAFLRFDDFFALRG